MSTKTKPVASLPLFHGRAVTITFAESAENHAGMQILGQAEDTGYTYADLAAAQMKFDDAGVKTELIDLREQLVDTDHARDAPGAWVLVVKGAAQAMLEKKESGLLGLCEEMFALNWDTKAKMRGRVVNKRARFNVCFAEETQEPDYEGGKGRVVPWHEVPLLEEIHRKLHLFFGEKSITNVAEGNFYYDVTKCGIGFHGDGERRRVIGLRLGAGFPIVWQWFLQGKPIGTARRFDLESGDMMMMSEKTVGSDWMRKVVPTLRHAAGCPKYIVYKPPKKTATKKRKL